MTSYVGKHLLLGPGCGALRRELFAMGLLVSGHAFCQGSVKPGQAVTDSVAAMAAQSAVSMPSRANEIAVRVYAKGNGAPLSKAEIKIGETFYYTDSSGVVKVPVASEAQISRHGYQAVVMSLKNADPAGISIYLMPAAPSDDVVVVRGYKRPEVSQKTVSAIEAAKVAPGGDAAQIVRLLPGVQAKALSPEVAVRGSGPADSRYYVDDIEVPYVFHRLSNMSIMPDLLLGDVDFESGGFGTQYGDAMGGVIVLRTKNEIPERAKTEVRVNIPFYASVYHERPLSDHESLAVSARRSYLEAFLPYILPKDANLTVSPYFGDLHAVYTNKEDGGYTKVLGIGSFDGLKLAVPTNNATGDGGRGQFDLYDGFAVLGVEREYQLGDGWQYRSTPQIDFYRQRETLLDNKVNIDLYKVRVPTELSKRLHGSQRFYVGIDPMYARTVTDILAPQPPRNDPSYDPENAPKETLKKTYDGTLSSAWIAIDQKWGDLVLTPGLRYFYNSQIRRQGVDPRLIGRYSLGDKGTLKAAVGQYSESPSPQDAAEEFGNPNLLFQRSMQYVAGWERDWSELWTSDIELYYKHAFALVTADPRTVLGNEASLKSTGFELFLRRNPTDLWFGWLSYTYSNTKQRKSDTAPWHNGSNDQTHVLNLVANYKFSPKWESGGSLSYHTGDTYTPIHDAVYNADSDKYEPRPNDADTYASRLPPYQEIDLYATRSFLYDTWQLDLRMGVEYLALERPAFGMQYNYNYTKSEYFRGIPPIPYFEVRGVL